MPSREPAREEIPGLLRCGIAGDVARASPVANRERRRGYDDFPAASEVVCHILAHLRGGLELRKQRRLIRLIECQQWHALLDRQLQDSRGRDRLLAHAVCQDLCFAEASLETGEAAQSLPAARQQLE